MVAIEAKFRIRFRPSAPQKLVRWKWLLLAKHQARNLQILWPLFFRTAWHRFPEAICITFSRFDSPGQWGKRGQHFGLFLDDAYVCDYMCKMGGCVEYNYVPQHRDFPIIDLAKGGQ